MPEIYLVSVAVGGCDELITLYVIKHWKEECTG